MRFDGVIVPVVTPFHDDFSIDEKSYAEMINRLIDSGVHGICVGGTTGENYALTPEERVWQFTFAHDLIKGRVPLVAGVNDIRTEEVCRFGEAAREAGADAILMGVPPYSIPSQKELAAHALRVDRATGLPVILYNYPGRSGAEFGSEFLDRVSRSVNFQAIKESSGDIDRIHMLAREYPHIQLSCGADDQAIEFFVWGAKSWVCAAGNFFASECVALYRKCAVEGDFESGRRMMKALLPVMTVLERGGKFMQCVKFASDLLGMPAGETVRLPLRPIKKELKRQLRDAVETAQTTISHLLANGVPSV